jgi:hypothetical protein
VKPKALIDDIMDALTEDGSFNETIKEFVEGQFESQPHLLKNQLDVILENVMCRLYRKEEDAMSARKAELEAS